MKILYTIDRPVGPVPSVRMLAAVPVAWIVVPVHVTPETVVAMKPWPRPDKYVARKPFRPIEPVRRAIVRRVSIISIRTHGFRPYGHTYLARRVHSLDCTARHQNYQ